MTTGFSAAELSENRAGRVHDAQRARGEARAEKEVRFGVVLQALGALLLLLPQVLNVFPRLLKDFEFRVPEQLEFKPISAVIYLVFGVFLGALPLLFGFTARREGLKALRAWRAARVEVVEARLRGIRHRRQPHLEPVRCFADQRLLSLGEVPWSAIDASRRSRVYVLAGLEQVLSVEPAP